MNPEPFLQLDRVIHEKGRLAIMSMLAASPELSFTELRDALSMTDGNLTSHMRTLQEAGYVAVSKSFQDNRSLTTSNYTGGEAGYWFYRAPADVRITSWWSMKSNSMVKVRFRCGSVCVVNPRGVTSRVTDHE